MKKVLSILLIMLILLTGCSTTGKAKESEVDTTDYSEIIKSAQTIKIEDTFLSIGKCYNVVIDDKTVATVRGKVFKGFGDTFTLETVNNVVLAKEVQLKR